MHEIVKLHTDSISVHINSGDFARNILNLMRNLNDFTHGHAVRGPQLQNQLPTLTILPMKSGLLQATTIRFLMLSMLFFTSLLMLATNVLMVQTVVLKTEVSKWKMITTVQLMLLNALMMQLLSMRLITS
jgi:hypothetical protein